MAERGPGWAPEQRPFPRPEPIIVMDLDNRAVVTRYLADVDHARRTRTDSTRIVLRPTPGSGDRTSVGLDLLAALGKNPDLLRQDKLGPGAWEQAGAWLLQAGITDLFLDRAHTLPLQRLQELLQLTIALQTSLWLIWSGPELIDPVETLLATVAFPGRPDRFRVRGATTIDAADLPGVLPLPDTRYARAGTGAAAPWPVLPTIDCLTFRAACRRHLPPGDFARVDAAYLHAADRTDAWINDRITTLIVERVIDDATDPDTQDERAAQAIAHAQLLVERQTLLDAGITPPADPTDLPTGVSAVWAGRPGPAQLQDLDPGQLTAWLRDTQLGPAPSDALALITLRATQVALLQHDILLCWNPGPLGPSPNARLRGDLTAQRANALYALGRTEHAAVTALSLHLNHPPTFFDCWRCGDVAPDGSTLHRGPHQHPQRNWLGEWEADAGGHDPCATTVRVPEHARRLIAAHLAYRRIEGAGDDAPFFLNNRDPGRPAAPALRARASGTCRRLNLDIPWLHGNSCRYGADIGLTPRSYSWLHERGLSLHQITPGIPDAYRRPRPASTAPAR